MNLEVADPKFLNAPAVAEYGKRVQEFAEALLKESYRLEAGQGAGAGDPQVVSAMVSDANTLLRKGYSRPRRSGATIAAQVTSYVAAIVVGLAAAHLDQTVAQVVFAVAVLIGVLTAVLPAVQD